MRAEVFISALFILMLTVRWCMIKMCLAVMAACKRTTLPVQCSEMEGQQRDRGVAKWREQAGERNSQTVNLRPGPSAPART